MNELLSRYGTRLQATDAFDLDAYPLSGSHQGKYLFFAYIRDEKLAHNDAFWEGLKSKFPGLVVLARAYKGAQKSEPIKTFFWDMSEVEEIWAVEGWLKFRLETGGVLNPGLFLDQKENRIILFELIQAAIKDKTFSNDDSFLNLFSYTGSFSITAVAAGVRKTTSVDVSSHYLGWEKKNFEANFGGAEEQGVEHRLIKDDARVFLTRAKKRGDRFRWIVIDPPTFSKGQGKPFKVSEELPQMAEMAMSCLKPGGAILVSSNDQRWSSKDFKNEFESLARKHKMKFTPGKLPQDFSTAHSLKSCWISSL